MGIDFGLGLGRLHRLHTMAIQIERPWEFIAKGSNFGLGLWRLHTMANRRFQILLFIAHFFELSPKVWLLNPMASQLGRP